MRIMRISGILLHREWFDGEAFDFGFTAKAKQ